MDLHRTVTSWMVVGILSAPIGLTGCSPLFFPDQSESSAVPMGAMVDHGMTMDLGPQDAEFDLRFIDGMILHHQGAIAMAEAVLQNSQRHEAKQLATNIIAAQQGEIDQMQQWRQDWYPDASSVPVMYDPQMGHTMAMAPGMQTAMMMAGGLGPADGEFDLRFINGMIPHHQAALAMAQQVIDNSARPELQQVAQNILTSQQGEIDQMEQWRKDWYGQ
ncbi:MAG: DUF305 domain-containing protein [Cyanobacteria bacterium]|nr:DUF305 domain-containing protein [Cyanobacteriota bacterium]MDA0865176.1 DUF305 domain-containing protein [Cyanobacteriota bacterium]